MSDHVKPPAAAAAESSKKDRRVLLLFIQEHWDENVDRYQVGWSDAKIAEDTGKPIEMVREVREAEFDGPGEDPGMVAFLEQQVAVSEELGVLARHLKELEASVKTTVAAWSEEVAKTDRVLKGYQQAHMALNAKVAALTQVADRVRQTEKKAG